MKLDAEQRPNLWDSSLEWKDYETYVFGSLQRLLPDAKVTRNIKIRGLLSGRSRQIDVLVERHFAGTGVKIVVDCKCLARKVHVKDVEAFLGMLDDLDIRKGALVTTKGYTKAAYNRASYGSRQTELKIISPDRLSHFQHMGCACAWVEPVGAVVSPPDGWVVDNEDSRPDRMQFVIYELGHTRDSALRRGAFIYGNIVLKRDGRSSLESIADWHEHEAMKAYPDARFKRLLPPTLPADPNGNIPKTMLREGYHEKANDWPEFSLYIDQPGGVLVLVLNCARSQKNEYLRRLLWVAEKTILMRVKDTRINTGRE
jgi:hypothetical protein